MNPGWSGALGPRKAMLAAAAENPELRLRDPRNQDPRTL
jgi:hypothetical protein